MLQGYCFASGLRPESWTSNGGSVALAVTMLHWCSDNQEHIRPRSPRSGIGKDLHIGHRVV